jgi:hypothetical protein
MRPASASVSRSRPHASVAAPMSSRVPSVSAVSLGVVPAGVMSAGGSARAKLARATRALNALERVRELRCFSFASLIRGLVMCSG